MFTKRVLALHDLYSYGRCANHLDLRFSGLLYAFVPAQS